MNTYFENSEIFENFDDEVFSNVVDPNAIIQGVTAVANVGSQIAQAKTTKEASRLDIEKLVQAKCGKRRGSKKKKQEFDVCAKPIFDQYEIQQKAGIELQQNQQRMAMTQIEQNKKLSQRNLYIGLGVLAVLIGVVVYFKRTS